MEHLNVASEVFLITKMTGSDVGRKLCLNTVMTYICPCSALQLHVCTGAVNPS